MPQMNLLNATLTADRTITFPNASGTLALVGSSGTVLQVVNASTTTQVTVATTVYTDTTLTATITPTSVTSKIIILVMQGCGYTRSASPQGVGVRLLRDATVIYTPVQGVSGPYILFTNAGGATSNSTYGNVQINYVDLPATTSAVTYKTQGRPYLTPNSGSAVFQLTDTVANQTSTIVLMEIAP